MLAVASSLCVAALGCWPGGGRTGIANGDAIAEGKDGQRWVLHPALRLKPRVGFQVVLHSELDVASGVSVESVLN